MLDPQQKQIFFDLAREKGYLNEEDIRNWSFLSIEEFLQNNMISKAHYYELLHLITGEEFDVYEEEEEIEENPYEKMEKSDEEIVILEKNEEPEIIEEESHKIHIQKKGTKVFVNPQKNKTNISDYIQKKKQEEQEALEKAALKLEELDPYQLALKNAEREKDIREKFNPTKKKSVSWLENLPNAKSRYQVAGFIMPFLGFLSFTTWAFWQPLLDIGIGLAAAYIIEKQEGKNAMGIYASGFLLHLLIGAIFLDLIGWIFGFLGFFFNLAGIFLAGTFGVILQKNIMREKHPVVENLLDTLEE